MKEARVRRDLWPGNWPPAATRGRPAASPRGPARARTLTEWAKQYQASRIDYADETTKSLGSHLKRILSVFGELEPEAIAWTDVQTWVAELANDLKPAR